MMVGAQDSSKTNSKGGGQLNTIYLLVKLKKSETIFVKKFNGLSSGRFMLLESLTQCQIMGRGGMKANNYQPLN